MSLPTNTLVRRYAMRRSRGRAVVPSVSRLPPELVCAVFRELQFAQRVVVSHVCGVWHEIVLADSALWTTIDLAGAQNISHACLDTLLARSRGLPVDLLGFTIATDASMGAATALATHLHHIRILEVNVAWHEVWDALQSDVLLHTPAPMLTALTVRSLVDSDATPTADDNIFAQHAPCLTHLHLEGIQPPVTPCPAFAQVDYFTYRRPAVQSEVLLPDLGRVFPRLQTYSLLHTEGRGPSTAPLAPPHALCTLVVTCTGDYVLECLSALFPDGHQDLPELIIDCPCSEDSMAYVLSGMGGTFDCTISAAEDDDGVSMTVQYEGGKTRHFQQPVSMDSMSVVLEWMGERCRNLDCPALLLSRCPPLPKLEKLTIDLGLDFQHTSVFDTHLAETLSPWITPVLQTVALLGHDSAYTRLRPQLFNGIIRGRKVLGYHSLVDVALDGIRFAGETARAAAELYKLTKLVRIVDQRLDGGRPLVFRCPTALRRAFRTGARDVGLILSSAITA